ncbi:MAG TPA: DUF2892 domain-containing protein [Anaerolineae bacterium]|nr:DUF2892 domain-containing protein [Anaerolineae bacterium]
MWINESPAERIIRLVLGGGLLTYGFYGLGGLNGSTAGIIASIAGGVLLLTAATGCCALYRVLGINTNCRVGDPNCKPARQ